MGTKRRNKKASNMTWLPKRECLNCLKQTRNGHFIPPSLGEPGRWACKKKEPSNV